MSFKFNISLVLISMFLGYSFEGNAMKRKFDHDVPSSAKKLKSELETKKLELCEHYLCDDKLDIYNCDPLTLIKHVSKHHLEDAIDAIFSWNSTSDSEEDDIYTSCYHTAYLIASIFLGVKEAQLCFSLLGARETEQFDVSWEGKKLLPFITNGLFDGARLLNYEINYNPFLQVLEQQSQILARSKMKMSTDFDDCFSKLRFSFNYDTIYELRRMINNNISSINTDNSMIYVIGIAKGDHFSHVCVVEQRLSGGNIQYVLYQSWKGKLKLADWLQRMESFDQIGIHRFLDKLKIILCDFDELKANYSSCFGVNSNRGPLLQCKNHQLTGPSLRFISYNIDPRSCAENLHELMFKCDS